MRKLMSQAGKPAGLVGRIFGYMMAWHNRPDNAWTLELLEIAAQDSVLEVGFGPGQAIKSLADANPSVRVAGVDHSEAMLASATRKNRGAIATGRVNLIRGSVERLPFCDASFDRAFCINCIYFWKEPLQGLRELRRVLRPGGRIAVTVRHKQRSLSSLPA